MIPRRFLVRGAPRGLSVLLVLAAMMASTEGWSAATAELVLPSGSILLQLLGDDGSPLDVGELPETIDAIAVELRSSSSAPVRIQLRLLAVDVLGLEPDSVLRQDSYPFRDGTEWRPTFRPLRGRFEVGSYAVEATAEDGTRTRLPFRIEPQQAPASLSASAPERRNVALAALGGRVVAASGPTESGRWAPDNLLDGFAAIRDRHGAPVSEGWRSPHSAEAPAEVVVGFYEGRAPVVEAVVIEASADYSLPVDFAGTPPQTGIPWFVEILAGDSPERDTLETIATVRLWNRTAPQLVVLEPRPIRYLGVRVLETYGTTTTAMGELRVLEAAGRSILDDASPNLALPALGGGLAAFSSQSLDNPAVALVDDRVELEGGWSSAESLSGDAAWLPQDLVFGFRGDRIAAVDRVEIDLLSSPRYATGSYVENWPRLVSIALSLDGPDGPFEELGRFELAQTPGPQPIPIGRPARYLRVRVLENHGGSRTTIGEIAVHEAVAPEGGSVLIGEAVAGWARDPGADAAAPLPEGREEREPNDDLATAEPLSFGTAVRGALATTDDRDRFLVSVEGDGPRTLTLEVSGEGPIPLRLDLVDGEGNEVKRFEPDGRVGHRERLTWRLAPGVYVLTARAPDRVTALVWDTSASMEGRTADLERAVRRYIESAAENEALLLIPFSDEVETLLPEPTRDRAALLAALEGHFRPDGGTYLFDAIAVALEALEGGTEQGTILVLTDGQDSGSGTLPANLRWRLARSNVRLVSIGLGTDLDHLGLATATTGHGVLRSLAQAGGGRYLVRPRSDELPALYAELAEELGEGRRYALRADLVEAWGHLAVTQVGERIPALARAARVTLVLDASGSMRRELAGTPRIEVAREVLSELTRGLPEDVEAGLWVFGHRVREGRSGDCEDIEELVALGALERSRMLDELARLRALGTTPLATTLERIGEGLADDGAHHVIVVVTDGEEECRDDLVAVSEALGARFSLTVHVVGFALDDPAVEAQLDAVARAGGGRFVNVGEAEQLGAALEAALGAPFAVLDSAGDVVVESAVGAPASELPVGLYSVRVETGGEPFVVENVEITPDATATLQLDRQGQAIGAVVLLQ